MHHYAVWLYGSRQLGTGTSLMCQPKSWERTGTAAYSLDFAVHFTAALQSGALGMSYLEMSFFFFNEKPCSQEPKKRFLGTWRIVGEARKMGLQAGTRWMDSWGRVMAADTR